MSKIKNILTISLFSLIIFGFLIVFAVLPKKDVSISERRPLAIFPEISVNSIFRQEFSEELETYFLDHAPLRETYRSINAMTRVNLLGQTNVNGLWTESGHIFKSPDKYDETQLKYGVTLINKIKDTYFKNNKVYFTVIPDKNYYLPEENTTPRFEYEKQVEFLNENLNAAYINLFDVLTLEDYYKTDSHWSQEKILKVADRLSLEMGAGNVPGIESYEKNTLSPFYGVYYGQAALSGKPDELHYLTSKFTDSAKVYGIDKEILEKEFGVKDTLSSTVYATDKFGGMDGYDVFLSGAQPLVVIETEADTDKELIMFRDSYGSSIAPLLTGNYSKITLVDLRYMPSVLIPRFVDVNENADVLFAYSNQIYNSAMLHK